MKGFNNIGNTCYLNSGLQMLVQNQRLCQLVFDYERNSEILNKIGNFIREYYEPGNSAIVPYEIKKLVENKQEIFTGFGQQDSTEFIIYMLDIIDEEVKKCDKNSRGIEPIFGIEFNTRIKCKLRECLTVYNRTERNNFLLLDIDSECKTLDDAYRNYKLGDKLEGEEKYFCERCNDKRVASKKSEITTWPNDLYIWLKRFKQEGRRITKNDQDIDIPFVWRHDNHLYGAVIHSGGLGGGHYIYISRHSDNKWYMYNDSSVSEINDENTLKRLISSAYWVYYRKM